MLKIPNILLFVILLVGIQTVTPAQDFKLGAFFAPGVSGRMMNTYAPDSLLVFTENDQPNFGSEAGLLFFWYPEDRVHVEGGLQLSKKGFKSVTFGENRFLDLTGIEIIGAAPDEVKSKIDFYYTSLSLRAGYDTYRNKSISIGVRGGFMLDMHLTDIVRQKAIYYDHSENIVLRPDFEGIKRFTVSGSFSGYINFVLSDNWEIALEPHCNLGLIKAIENSRYDMRFFNAGIRMSILLLLDFNSGYRNPVFGF